MVVVITGAASGIGHATALRFARDGAKVHLCDINADGLESVRHEIANAGGRCETHVVDVTKPAEVEALAERVFASDGAVDVLHNNAGIVMGGPVDECTLDDWRRVIDINVMGVVYGVHFFMKRMLQQGRHGHIVNTASGAGLFGIPYLAPYCASKYAVVGLTDALNTEMAGRGISVSAICPGAVYTPIVRNTPLRGELIDAALLDKLFRRFSGSAEDVANAVVKAVRTRRVIVTVAHLSVEPAWLLQRLSPQAYQTAGKLMVRLQRRLGQRNTTEES